MSEFQKANLETLDDLENLKISNKIADEFGKWQKKIFDETGKEAPLMPADPWLIKWDLTTKLEGKGESTDKVPVFGEKTFIHGLDSRGSKFTISTVMENPYNENSAIILVKTTEGTRPFLVIFEDTVVGEDWLAFSPGGDQRESILDINTYNNYNKYPFDLETEKAIARQLDGSSPVKNTEPLSLIDIFNLIGSEVMGFQTDRVDVRQGLNGTIGFSALFDNKTGLEILAGIINSNGDIIEPLVAP